MIHNKLDTSESWEPERIPGCDSGAGSLSQILASCLDSLNAGKPLDVDRVVAAHPQQATRLRRELLALRALCLAAEGAPPAGTQAAPRASLPSGEPPQRLGDYELLQKLGEGGMGEVYLARQISLGRRVALKLLAPSTARNVGAVQRFLREARAAGAIDNPGIVSIFEAGVLDGRHYIAMRYVEGETLAERIAATRQAASGHRTSGTVHLPSGAGDREEAPGGSNSQAKRGEILTALLFIERVARALHSAHEHGLIHRDIKPSNIMVTPEGDPVILDFGLARLNDDEATLTRTGDLVGTPAYIRPQLVLRQAECWQALGEFAPAEAMLRGLLEQGGEAKPGVCEAWFAALVRNGKPDAAQCLRRLPAATAGGVASCLEDVRWTLECLAASGELRINCGGPERAGASGALWGRDRFWFTSSPRDPMPCRTSAAEPAVAEISHTDDDFVYQTERWFECSGSGYRIPLPPGRYRVALHFAEVFYRERNARVFDLRLEGTTLLEGYEPHAAGFASADVWQAEVGVDDGFLDIELVPRIGAAKISGIVVQDLRRWPEGRPEGEPRE